MRRRWGYLGIIFHVELILIVFASVVIFMFFMFILIFLLTSNPDNLIICIFPINCSCELPTFSDLFFFQIVILIFILISILILIFIAIIPFISHFASVNPRVQHPNLPVLHLLNKYFFNSTISTLLILHYFINVAKYYALTCTNLLFY